MKEKWTVEFEFTSDDLFPSRQYLDFQNDRVMWMEDNGLWQVRHGLHNDGLHNKFIDWKLIKREEVKNNP